MPFFASRRPTLALLTGLFALSACAEADPLDGVATRVGDWRDEIIYQIVVDRFENGDPGNDSADGFPVDDGSLARFQGGDWAGIEQRLGYLERLGATALWISPVVANTPPNDQQDGYHGYWPADFTSVNPRFGSLDDLQRLVRSAHARDIKVIIDVVANHAGRVFYYDLDRDGQPAPNEIEPPYSETAYQDVAIEWLVPPPPVVIDGEITELELGDFHRFGNISNGGDQRQKERGDFVSGLRDLATGNERVMRAMVDTMVYWVELTDIDGIRLDAVPHVPHEFWFRYADELRAQLAERGKERFLLLGEVFNADPAVLAEYTDRGGLDSVFDFTFKRRLIDEFLLDGRPAERAARAMTEARDEYPNWVHPGGVELTPWQARVAFADNHDMRRLRGELDDLAAAKLAMTATFTTGGIPAVYYGTEQDLDGPGGNESREVMWETQFFEDAPMYLHIAELARVRRRSEALRRGETVYRYASEVAARTETGPDSGLLAWERFTARDRALVVLNGDPDHRSAATMQTGFGAGTKLCTLLGDHAALRTDNLGRATITVAPRAAVILTPCD